MGVEQRGREETEALVEDLEVLAGRVQDLGLCRISQPRGEWGQILQRQRIDAGGMRPVGQLHQTQLGAIGALA